MKLTKSLQPATDEDSDFEANDEEVDGEYTIETEYGETNIIINDVENEEDN